MSDVKLKPVVVPRGWDGHRLHFALVFSFEIASPSANAVPVLGTTFQNWPQQLAGLLPAAGGIGTLPLKLTPDGGAAVNLAVSRSQIFDLGKSERAWKAIFDWRPDRLVPPRSGSPLAAIFTGTQAPKENQSVGGSGGSYGRNVAINPRGGSDLRPTQRVESLELGSARSFIQAADTFTAALRNASRHDLAKAKTVAFRYRELLSQKFRTQAAAGVRSPAALAQITATSIDLEGASSALVTALHFTQEAGNDGARLQRSVDLARNRPAKAIDPRQVTQPTTGEMLARLKQYPGAMRVLGLVVDCFAAFDPGNAKFITGKVSVGLDDLLTDGTTYNVATRFELQLNPDRLFYFRAAEQSGEIDDTAMMWRQFHLLPPSYFSLQQTDHVRTVVRAQQDVRSSSRAPRSTTIEDALSDAIIIQAEYGSHSSHSSAADVTRARLQRAQVLRNGTDDKPPPKPGDETLLYAEDLISGVTFEVAGGDEQGNPRDGWYSLCRRHLVVTHGDQSLFECEEDGYVSISATMSAPPLVGGIESLTKAVPDPTNLDKYTLQIVEDAAYNTPSAAQKTSPAGYVVAAQRQTPRTSEELAKTATANEPAAQPTQLRGIFRNVISIADLTANPPAVNGQPASVDGHDRVHLTNGPQVDDQHPTFVESLFLSPLFSTDVWKDQDLAQTGLQLFQADNPLRGERFQFAFDGAVTAFLDADGTVFTPATPSAGTSWLSNGFANFEAEGEHRAYAQTASDLAAAQPMPVLTDAGRINGVISDSLPHAALTPDHAMLQGRNVTLLPLPFVPPGKSDRFTRLESPAATYPLQFRFRGRLKSATPTVGSPSTVDLRLVGFNEAPVTPVLVCPAGAISDRAGHAVALTGNGFGATPVVVSGDGILERPGGSFTVLQLHVLGKAGATSGEAAIAEKDPFMAWMPRVARIEQTLQPVRGPVTGEIGFDAAGKIKAGGATANKFRLASAADDSGAQEAYTVSLPDIAARNPPKMPAKVVLPAILTASPPVDNLIISANGRVEDVFLWQNGTRSATPEAVLLVETWNVLASGPTADEVLSDAARAAKSSPHLDWIVTVETDNGYVPVGFDATLVPKVTTRLFHPLDLRLGLDVKQQPLWIDALCVDQLGQLRGIGWPSWIAAYAPKTTPKTARTLTLLDMRSLRLNASANDVGSELTGYFKLTGQRGSVSWDGPAAFVEARSLLNLLGEVVSNEISARDCILHIAGLSSSAPWQAQLRGAPTDRFGDLTSEMVSRRVIDLQPGDCVFALVRPDPNGWFEVVRVADNPDAGGPPADTKNTIAMSAGLFGHWTPGATSASVLTKTVLAFGSIDYLPGTVTTPRGVVRTVWGPCPLNGATTSRTPLSNPLLSDQPLNAAMLHYVPLAFVQTMIAHAKPQALANPSMNINALATVSFPAVHAVASDALARWRGWWLTVPQSGTSDLTGSDTPNGWPIRLTSKPSGRMLPLRTGRTYWIRGWRTDLAGNIGHDTLDTRAREVFDRLQQSTPHACAQKFDKFRRPDSPLAPLLAQPGNALNKPEFSFVALGLDLAEGAKQQPGALGQSLNLVLVTNRRGTAVPPRRLPTDKSTKPPSALYYASGYLLPPPVDVETALSSGLLDHNRDVQVIIYQHEQFYEDHLFGRRPSAGLNYFPDPFATVAVLRVAETLPSVWLQPGGLASGTPPGPWSAFEQLTFFPKGNWPQGDVAPRIELVTGTLGVSLNGQGAIFRVPPAAAAQAQIVAVEPNVTIDAAAASAGLTLDLIHAVTGPLRQPEWMSFTGDPPRKPGDTAQAFAGQLRVDRPSTGSVEFSMFWTDLWDETVPALFVAARVRAQVSNGTIVRVIVDDPGFGYGTSAVVKPINAKSGQGAVLLPVVKDGKLSADVVIEAGGTGYPDGDIGLSIVRRPPLYILAAAVARVSGGRIIEVMVAEGASDNGYYARPPLVRFHDMEGTGVGATCRAIVADGRVTKFAIDENGHGHDYSENVIVGLYTNEAVILEQPVDERASISDPAWSPWPFKFSYAFGDTRARHLYIVGQGRTRFRDEVETEEPMATELQRYELVGTARPPKPEIAYVLPSFRPVHRFVSPPGHLIEQRDGLIRCYVYRPWNATGDEKLGAVVYAAQINTTLVKEDALHEGLIPGPLRTYVSRWGFDPVWDDVATAPLTADDFTSAIDVVRYDDLAEVAGGDQPPVGVALHEMQYSASRDMWYADIAIRPPERGMPFVQLALVRYRPSSVPGLSMSEVALADPIVLPGQRRLSISRISGGAQVEVRGNFDGPRAQASKALFLPLRKMVVELRTRSPDLPTDIEGQLAFGDGLGPNSLDAWELRRADPSMFVGKIPLEANALQNAGNYYLAVKELEVFPTGASYRDRTGSTGTITGGRPTFERLVFYRRLDVTELLSG